MTVKKITPANPETLPAPQVDKDAAGKASERKTASGFFTRRKTAGGCVNH